MSSPSSSSPAPPTHVIGTPQEEAQKALSDFRAIEMYRPKDTTLIAQRFRLLNRYLDVVPFDKYVYPSPDGAHTLYINGSLIECSVEGTAVSPLFVACQAPIPAGVFDFLAAIVATRMTLVLMLTSLEEGGVVKADRYWPETAQKGATLTVPSPDGKNDAIIVEQAEDEVVEASLCLTRRVLRLRQGTASHVVTQVQYTGWPDHGVPSSTNAFCHLIKEIESYTASAAPASRTATLSAVSERLPGKALSATHVVETDAVRPQPPVLVHCSAGVGRTGTLIAAYAGVQLAKSKGRTLRTLPTLVMEMRRRRPYMVQRFEQYLYANTVILDHCGANVESFQREMNAAVMQYNIELQERLRLMMAAQRK